jgi:hypothetical protein
MFIHLPAVLAGAGSGLVAARNTAFRVAWERGKRWRLGVVERREGSERTEPDSDGGAAQIFKPAERFFTAWRRVLAYRESSPLLAYRQSPLTPRSSPRNLDFRSGRTGRWKR